MSSRTACFVALMIIFAPLAGSAGDEKKALIHELMGIIAVEDLLRQSIDRTLDFSFGEEELDGLPPEERLRYEEMRRRETEHRAKVLQRVDIGKYSEQLFYPLFERYTASELKDAIAFYKTPAGQKSVALMPELVTVRQGSLRLMSEALEAAEREIRDEEVAMEPPWKRTMSDIRSVATATEAYATDMNEYPRATTIAELDTFIAPTYIRTTPRKDGWGREFTYVVSPDLQHYRFVSAGADGRLEFDSTRVTTLEPELKAQQRATTDPDEDIVYQDGAFVRCPAEAMQRNY